MYQITRTLASQIVNAVKDVCEKDINFITPAGQILASTDSKRIGTYHEIGHQAAKDGQLIQIHENALFAGTKAGVNLPVYHNGELLAVIGISGAPEEVLKYANLAEHITKLLVRENEGNLLSRSLEQKRTYLIQKLLRGAALTEEDLKMLPTDAEFHRESPLRLLMIRLNQTHEQNLSAAEPRIYQLFRSLDLSLFCYQYPREYLAVIEDSDFQKNREQFQIFALANRAILKIAVGRSAAPQELSSSFQSAQTAMKSFSFSNSSFVVFDDLNLELLLSAADQETRREYLSRTMAAVKEEDLKILQVYYEENMSLAAVCRRLYLHKNTLQYRLNRISKITGLNPRYFHDAVLLYLGQKLLTDSEDPISDGRFHHAL